MKIDFFEQYRHYPTAELLLITRQSQHYQPEAVEAAHHLLASRNISADEMTIAEKAVMEKQTSMLAQQKIPLDELKTNLVETLRPLLTAGVKPTPDQWFRIILLACGIELVISAYSVLTRTVFLFFNGSFYFDFSLLSYFLPAFGGLALTLIIFISLYRKLRMGWILFYVFNLVVLIAAVMRVIQPASYSYGANELKIVFDGVLLLLRIAMAVIMWKSEIADFFQVRKTDKLYSVLAAILLIVLIIVVAYMAN